MVFQVLEGSNPEESDYITSPLSQSTPPHFSVAYLHTAHRDRIGETELMTLSQKALRTFPSAMG